MQFLLKGVKSPPTPGTLCVCVWGGECGYRGPRHGQVWEPTSRKLCAWIRSPRGVIKLTEAQSRSTNPNTDQVTHMLISFICAKSKANDVHDLEVKSSSVSVSERPDRLQQQQQQKDTSIVKLSVKRGWELEALPQWIPMKRRGKLW